MAALVVTWKVLIRPRERTVTVDGMFSLYMFALFMGCVLCNRVMRAAKTVWPRPGTVGLVAPTRSSGTHAGAVPRDGLERSYLQNGRCGPGTDQACPGPRVPVPVGPDSAHATPDGGFDSPKGLPSQVAGE